MYNQEELQDLILSISEVQDLKKSSKYIHQ